MKVDWKMLVSVLGPVILASVPHADRIAPLVPTIVDGITEAQAIKGATGAEKRAHVLALAANAMTGINQAKGRVLLDPESLQTVVGSGIDAVVGTVNLVHSAHTQAGVLLPPPTAAQLGIHTGSTGE